MLHVEIGMFIEALFGDCQKAADPGYLTLTAIHPNGDRPTPSRHIRLGNQPALERAVDQLLEANAKGWGAFIGIATRQRNLGRWSRGGKNDLACLPALFVDLDDPDLALWRLCWFDLPASMIVASGRGFHAYWKLDTPTTDLITAEQAIRGLSQHLHGDPALTVAQSMRLVGTLNTKPGRGSAPCEFISFHPDRTYKLSDFNPFTLNRNIAPHPPSYHPIYTTHRKSLIDTLTAAVINQLDGYWRSNGYIAARCPLPHERDRAGMHFSYHAATGWGHCFGKHGVLSFDQLCRLLNVPLGGSRTA
jgi:hypothetical protein